MARRNASPGPPVPPLPLGLPIPSPSSLRRVPVSPTQSRPSPSQSIATIELSAPVSAAPTLRRGVVLSRAPRDARWPIATHHPALPCLLSFLVSPPPHLLVSPARRVTDTVSALAVAERPHFNTTRACEQQREGNSGSPYGIVYRCRGRGVALAQRRECRAPIWSTLTCAGRSFLHGSHCDGPNLARSHQHGHSGRVVRTPPPLVRGAERHEDRAKAPRRCEVVYEGDVDPRL